jgi:hypothetical protein
MNGKFTPDQQDASDDDFNVVGGEIFASFSPWASWLSDGNPFAPTAIPSLSTEAGGTVSLGDPSAFVPVTSGGITINLIFDAAALAAPASFRAGIQQAVAILAAAISDKITVNIKIDYSGTGGGAFAGPDHGVLQSYSSIRADLVNNASPGDTTFNALAAGSSIQGQPSVAVWNAQLKLWGLMAANDTTTDDGSATFATDINPNLLVGVALHELTHAMGRVPFGAPNNASPDIFDLFRFTSPGTRLFQGGATAPAAYFSLDGGNTKIADYGRTSDASDFLNSGVQGPNDPFNEFYTGSTSQQLTAVDLKQLDALGFHLMVPDTQAPVVSTDNPLSVQTGGIQTITSSLLGASDNASSGAQLHYTVTTGPAWGTLLLSGAVASSFTQADINNGLVSYHETATGVASDSFSFNVTDAAGNMSGISSFQVHIGSPISEDFNADGKSDALWVGNDGTATIWDSGQSSAAHQISSPMLVPASEHIAGTGDFDGNGHDDILWRDDSGFVFVWDNGQSSGAHQIINGGGVPSSQHIAGTGDFDGNGHDDILWRDDSGGVFVWNNGQASGGHTVGSSVAASWHVAGTGDFDGNGKADILWHNDSGETAIWDNGSSSGGHSVAPAGSVAASWHIAGTGDFDGNGKSDILWYNDNGAVAVWDNGQASGGHSLAAAGSVAASWHIAGTGDFDGNGKADIFWQNDNGSAAIWDNGQPSGGHVVGAVPAGWHII